MSTTDARKRNAPARALWAEYLELDSRVAAYLCSALVEKVYHEDPDALARLIDEAKANAS
jgi:hypothetical protein